MNSTLNNSSLLNSKSLFICLFILFAGLSTGIFFTFLISSEDKLYLSALLQSALETGNLKTIPLLLCNFIWLALIFVSGLTVYGIPFSLLLLFFRTMALGVCLPVAAISPNLDLFLLFLFNLLFSLTLLVSAMFSINYASPLFRNKSFHDRNLSSHTDIRNDYLTFFAMLTAVTAVISLLESLIL